MAESMKVFRVRLETEAYELDLALRRERAGRSEPLYNTMVEAEAAVAALKSRGGSWVTDVRYHIEEGTQVITDGVNSPTFVAST